MAKCVTVIVSIVGDKIYLFVSRENNRIKPIKQSNSLNALKSQTHHVSIIPKFPGVIPPYLC